MAAAKINGTPVNFGFHTTTDGITLTGPSSFVGTMLLQSADFAPSATRETTMDSVGNMVVSAWTDPHAKASLEWVVKGASLAAAITASTLGSISPGDFVVITVCASMPDLVGSTWEIIDVKVAGANNNAKKITLTVEKRAGITAAAA